MDDDADLLRLYEAALAATFRVRTCRDAASALDALVAPPDLVVLDAHLPGTSGFELAAEVRRRGHQMPIVFVSGVYKAARHRDAAQDEFDAADFLEKPVPPDELHDVLRALVPSDAPTMPLPSIPPGAPRGELARRPLHDVLAELFRARATGQLSVRRERVKKLIRLRDGAPIAAKSNLVSECLGRVLVRAGQLSEEECESSLALMRTDGILQGAALVRLGHLRPDELGDALALQLEFRVASCLEWESGDWQFVPDDVEPPEPPLRAIPTPRLVVDGLARTWDEARLRAALGPGAETLAPVFAPEAAALVSSIVDGGPLEGFVRAADGTRSVAELLDANVVPRTRALALLVALRAFEAVTLETARPVPLVRRTSPPRRSPPRVDADDPAALRKLARRLAELERATHYEALDVPRTADAETIRRSWLSLARDHHPDKHFQQAPRELRELAESLFERLSTAWTVLSDPDDRARYDASTAETPAERADRILRADEAFRAGRAAFAARRFAEAESLLRGATDAYADEALFHAWLALALFHAHPDDQTAATHALAALDTASALDPRLPEAPLFAAHVHRALGDDARAAAALAHARALGAAA